MSNVVGGGTHPGRGLPIVLESARIKANGILAQDKLPLHPVKPLPKIENYSRKEFKLKQRAAAILTNS